MATLARGSQKVFLRRIWNRIHAVDNFFTPPCTPKYPKSKEKLLSLWVPDDKDWLTPRQIALRKSIEVFEVTERDTSGDESIPNPGHIGLRCAHCSNNGINVKVCFPHSINTIFDIAQKFGDHLINECKYIPQNLTESLRKEDSKASSKDDKRYYNLSARFMLKLKEDTQNGFLIREKAETSNSDEERTSSSASHPLDLLARVSASAQKSRKRNYVDIMAYEAEDSSSSIAAPKFPRLKED